MLHNFGKAVSSLPSPRSIQFNDNPMNSRCLHVQFNSNVLVNPLFLTTPTLHLTLGTPTGLRDITIRNAVIIGTLATLLKVQRKNKY